jgi:hypothetical protein
VGTEGVRVIVDGVPATLQAVHVAGTVAVAGDSGDVEFWWLDDAAARFSLKFVFQGSVSQIVRIDRPVTSPEPARTLEQTLASKACRTEVPGVYFLTDSAELLAASEPAIERIADVMKQQPGWRVTIEGHTDSTAVTLTILIFAPPRRRAEDRPRQPLRHSFRPTADRRLRAHPARRHQRHDGRPRAQPARRACKKLLNPTEISMTTRTVLASAATLILGVVLVACGESAGTSSGASGGSAAASGASGGHDPCSLLEPKEVEAVMGPLAGPPFRTHDSPEDNAPDANGKVCVYETADFSNIRLSVEWEDGAMLLKAVSLPGRIVSGAVPESQSGRLDTPTAAKETITKNMLPGGVQMAGEWDEAMALGCCQIFALRGDTLVTFDFRGWRDDLKGAASILDKALVRIEKPLSIDGRAGNDAAAKREAQRPAKRDACSLITRAEVEAILGPLLADPETKSKDNSDCWYRFTQAESENSTLKDAPEAFKSILGGLTGGKTGLVSGAVDTAITITWRGGFRAMHDGQMVAGGAAGAFNGLPGMPAREAGKLEGPWTEASQTSLTFTAVKKDVAVSIDTVPMLSNKQVEIRRKLVTAIIGKI